MIQKKINSSPKNLILFYVTYSRSKVHFESIKVFLYINLTLHYMLGWWGLLTFIIVDVILSASKMSLLHAATVFV